MRYLRSFLCAAACLAAAGGTATVYAEETAAAGAPAVTGSTMTAASVARTNLEKLASPDPYVRRNAAILLGSEKKKENVPALLALLDDGSPEVRRAAISALGNTGDQRAVAPLAAHYKTEKNLNVQMDIIIALGDIKSAASVPFLRGLLKDPYPVFRSEALRALGKINAPDTHATMVAMLKDEAEGVRVIAADVVGALQLRGAGELLVKNLEDPAVVVRRSCAQALGIVGGAAAVPGLQKLLNDKDALVVKVAQEAIALIEKRQAAASLPKKTPAKR